MTIWRIFRKDWTLLWPMVAAVAFTHAMGTMLWWLRDHAHIDELTRALSNLIPLVALLGTAILAISVLHTDPIPGDRQDWLARPIRRGDLLAAKLLFVLLAAVAPAMGLSAVELLADGFSLSAAAGAALGRSLALLVAVCLPAMILAALTRNAVEALMAAVFGGALIAGISVVIINLFQLHPTVNVSGLVWTQTFLGAGLILVAALIVLPLQYWRRSTVRSRLLAIPLFLTALLVQDVLTWDRAFSAQQMLAPHSTGDDKVTIGFDPGLGRSPRTAIGSGLIGHAVLVNLPVRVDGVANGDVFFADRAEVRLVADGKVIYRQDAADGSYSIPAWVQTATRLRQHGPDGQALLGYQSLLLPIQVMNRNRDSQLTLELDYSITLFREDVPATIAALDGSAQLGKIGGCTTQVDEDGDEIALKCLQPGQVPNCVSAVLENPATGQRNPEMFACAPDYSPMPIHFIFDALGRAGVELKFRDAGNAAQFPVGESQLGTARVNVTPYQPAAHFTRHVVIRNIRLGDWEAPSAPSN